MLKRSCADILHITLRQLPTIHADLTALKGRVICFCHFEYNKKQNLPKTVLIISIYGHNQLT